MKEFRAYNSRWRMALLLAGCLGFVVIGLWMAGVLGEGPDPSSGSRRLPPEYVPYFGLLCAIFFGAGLPILAKRFFESEPQVEIGRAGIRVAQWSDVTIPWHEIKGVTVWSYRRQKHIILKLHRPEAFPGRGIAARLAAANRILTGGDIAIGLVGTDGKFDDAMAAISTFGGRGLIE